MKNKKAEVGAAVVQSSEDLIIPGAIKTPIIVLNCKVVELAHSLAIDTDVLVKAGCTDKTVPKIDTLFGNVSSCIKKVEDQRKEVKAPFLDLGKKIDAAANSVLIPLLSCKERLGIMMVMYKREKEIEKQKELARAEEEARKRKEREEQAKGPATSFEEAVEQQQPQAAQQVVKIEVPTFSTVKLVTRKELKIVDESLIPRQYLVPDTVKIRKELLEGAVIPGCRLEEVTSAGAK